MNNTLGFAHRFHFRKARLSDFLERVHPDEPEARALIHAGACDALPKDGGRAELLWELACWMKTRQNPAKTALNKGIPFTIHLDTPITPINPLLLVWSAVNRRSTGGNIIGEDERISAQQALRATTIDAAWQIFQEGNRGSIETGKYADLVVVSANFLRQPETIKDIEVLETIVGGKTVYENDERKNK